MAGAVSADSTIVYDRIASGDLKTRQTISISGRWLRIDSEPKGKADYILMDTGRMLMFEVDDAGRRFHQSHVGQFYWPERKPPKLKPVMEKMTVSGVRCQKIGEWNEERQVREHCMVAGSALGLNERETKTLSRLFAIAGRIGWDLPGVSTRDERQVSISSQGDEEATKLQFVSVAHDPIPDVRMKIPDHYEQIWTEHGKPPVKPVAGE